MSMIEVRDLRKVYGKRVVVDGVSFTVEQGEIFGILGPNGAGKTTTVECIGGLRQRDGGSITVAGMDPANEGKALREALGDWADLNAVAAQLRTSGSARDTDHDAVLVRVCQEALSNVARHAGADRVAVTLTYLEDEVLLDIRDDGTGFDPNCTPHPDASGGHGLPGMAERLRLADGRLAVESEPGGGCVVSAAVRG